MKKPPMQIKLNILKLVGDDFFVFIISRNSDVLLQGLLTQVMVISNHLQDQ